LDSLIDTRIVNQPVFANLGRFEPCQDLKNITADPLCGKEKILLWVRRIEVAIFFFNDELGKLLPARFPFHLKITGSVT